MLKIGFFWQEWASYDLLAQVAVQYSPTVHAVFEIVNYVHNSTLLCYYTSTSCT